MEIPYRASFTETVDSVLPALPEAHPVARRALSVNHPVTRTCLLLALTVAYPPPLTQILCYVVDPESYGHDPRRWFPAHHQSAADKLLLEQYLRPRDEPITGNNGLLQRRDDVAQRIEGIRNEYGYHTK